MYQVSHKKNMQKIQRRYDLDWLRVIAILLVLYFHTAMIFAEGQQWHIKNTELSSMWTEFNFWLTKFRMPLLFFISGVGSFFALRKRTGKQYLKERHNRLMIPLLFAMFFIVPPQIYFERIFNGEAFDSFLHFYPSTFEFIPYPEGNLSWHHMWFVLYLFVYSAVGLPLFLFLKSPRGQRVLDNMNWLSRSKNIYLFAVPTILIYITLVQMFPRTNDLVHDWGYLPYWFTFFFTGYLVASKEQLWESIERNRKFSLQMAIACIVFINFFRWNNIEPWSLGESPLNNPWTIRAFLTFLPLDGWFWLLALLGYGRRYLNRPHRLLSYANEGIYPFYILHQTVIIVVGYYVIQVPESVFAKYIFVSTLALVGSVAIYDFLIRPYPVMRFLFGMKGALQPKKQATPRNHDKTENSREAIKAA